MKRNLIQRVELDASSADFFEDEVTGYMEARGFYWLNDEDIEDEGHPFTLTVELAGEWVDFNDHACGLCEEQAERAILSQLREQLADLRAMLEDHSAY